MYHEKATTVVDVNACDSNPCLNGATCEDKLNGYECSCKNMYDGVICGAYSYQYYTHLVKKLHTYLFIGEQIISKYLSVLFSLFSNECWARTCHNGIRLSSFRNIYKKFYWFCRGLPPLEVTGNCIGGFSDANCKPLPNYYYIPRVNKLYMPKCINNRNCAQMLNHA